jgi:transposase
VGALLREGAIYSNVRQWKRIRNRVLLLGESKRGTARKVGISRTTLRKMLLYEFPPGYGGSKLAATKIKAVSEKPRAGLSKAAVGKQRWMEWLYELEREKRSQSLWPSVVEDLIPKLVSESNDPRKKILVVLAHQQGFSIKAITRHLGISRNAVRGYLSLYAEGGATALLGKRRSATRKADGEEFKRALFGLLHEPPALSGFNRTTWRMADLQAALRQRGNPACASVIREAIRKAGYRWRSAKVVLTSNDPNYYEKLERIQTILSNLGADERFFSIDEFGPFAIKAKPGRLLAEPGCNPSVPQWPEIQRVVDSDRRSGAFRKSNYPLLFKGQEYSRDDPNGPGPLGQLWECENALSLLGRSLLAHVEGTSRVRRRT